MVAANFPVSPLSSLDQTPKIGAREAGLHTQPRAAQKKTQVFSEELKTEKPHFPPENVWKHGKEGWASSGDSEGEESACSAGDVGSIPGWGRSPGGGHGNPLQYSCLENPMDRGACWVMVHGVPNFANPLHLPSSSHQGWVRLQRGGPIPLPTHPSPTPVVNRKI